MKQILIDNWHWILGAIVLAAYLAWPDSKTYEPDETSHKGRYKFTHPEKEEEEVIF